MKTTIAHIIYFCQVISKKKEYENYQFKSMGRFSKWYDHEDKYGQEYERNSYYNLQGFKEMWEQAKEDGDGMTNYG